MYRVLVWGCGNFYRAWCRWLPENYQVIGFIHSDPAYKKTYFENLPVYMLEEIKKTGFDKIIIAAGEKTKYINMLLKLGVTERQIEQLEFVSQSLFDSLDHNRKKVLTYYAVNQNLGDLLNAFLQDYLFHVNTEWTDLEHAELISIGSILNRNYAGDKICKNNKPLMVWGSGFLDSPRFGENKFYRKLDIRALRGKLSLQIAEDILGHTIHAVTGDPGLLCSELGIHAEPKYDIGIIPHYQEINNTVFIQYLNRHPQVHLINMREHPKKVIEEISSCRTILSNSLHGLIIADSFSIPNLWIRIRKQTLGNSLFKYWDYYSVYDDVEIKPYWLDEIGGLERKDIVRKYQIKKEQVDKIKLNLIRAWNF